MSKRCKLQKEYFKQFGFYKGKGKYTDHYVNWLESQVLELRLSTDGSNEVELNDLMKKLAMIGFKDEALLVKKIIDSI